MGLDYEYGINTGNRFLDLVDHDEDPEEFVAKQTQPEDKSKKSTKDSKTATSATTRKTSAKTTTTSSATNETANTTRTNKENFTGKSTTNVHRGGQQSNVLSDNVNQQTRIDSGRGGGRGFSRRGTGQDRPAYEGGSRGGGPHRSQRFQRFEGQQGSHEARSFEQTGEVGEGGNNNQRFGGYQGRGRGGDRGRGSRGTFYNRNFEGGRGRGRGGRGYFNNRNADESSQQQQQQQPQTQDISQWQPNTDSTSENASAEPAKTTGQEFDADQTVQDRSLEPDGVRRGGRGHFRARTFRSNRNFDQDRQYQHDQEGGQEEYRRNRRQHDRQPRSYTSGVKPVEKKDGEGAHNWGNAAEIPDVEQAADDSNETADQAASTSKNWSDQVDEAEKKQLTLDEYKKQIEEKKRLHQEKLPQFNPRAAGEGEDPKNWQFKHEYRKKNDNEDSEEEAEEGSGTEEEENEDEDEHVSGKKRLITIPLHFNPTELSRGGSFGPRGGPRRGGRYRDRPYRDDQQRSKSPNQQQSPTFEQTDENRFDDQQQKPYRGGARQGPGRTEYRRPYGNSARGSRGGYNRSHANPNTPDFHNTLDFPTLPKQ
ncbi:unnamed protein product [Adineta ricciae]|uniref:Hyaluronan/mRNA-binding protein domain-containing protein n=1 Tax=Adineta ricciae TaxID=249248 RepID=A0A813WVA9_ADIRI|nr:unnamed protein product [Adineta ricciae]